jgi:ATP-dependent DNA helicase DinG
MISHAAIFQESEAVLPLAAAVLKGTGVAIQSATGESEPLAAAEGLGRLAREAHLVCHAPYLIDRLALIAQAPSQARRAAYQVRHFDVAELFLFVRPAQFAVPTAQGLARALGIGKKDDIIALRKAAETLLKELASDNYLHPREAFQQASFLARTNWPWARAVLRALGERQGTNHSEVFATGLNVWDRIAEWEDHGPSAKASQHGVEAEDALKVLDELLGEDAEARPQQKDYCAQATRAFAPRQARYENTILLAEAGTGLGKTLAYLAPAHVWAKRNGTAGWVSTFTKNLQRQLEQETARLYPDPGERRQKVVIRKGRENYLCLLNMQETFGRLATQTPRGALLATLIARWARYSRDGDMAGGDFPTWLMSLRSDAEFDDGRRATALSLGLTDRRGECIYSACPHYRRCFIEKAVRASRKAEIVIANHALVLHQVAVDHALGLAKTEEEQETTGGLKRIVFDEGHHLFDAADSAFSGHLTGMETAELRRWIRGSEVQGRRGRSLTERIGDLTGEDEAAEKLLQQTVAAARLLPGPGWLKRIQAGAAEGPAETFLLLVRQQVLARAENGFGPTLETDCQPLIEGLSAEAGMLAAHLIDLKQPMLRLAQILLKKLDRDAAELDSSERARIEALARSLRRRGELTISGWIEMLNRLIERPNPRFVDWLSIDQTAGREMDMGLHSHWVDPTQPLAETVLKPADGVLITSATLKDRPPESPHDWHHAEMRTGVVHLPYPVLRVSHDSPYDYPENSRVIIVNDVNRDDMDQMAAAYRELFLAAGGGALGLFTAISRLKAVHLRLIEPLARQGLMLLAQHVDPIDTGTLVDMFRAERDACLLGTDAVRDGVDVPGDSLRLIVLDRVPWGQPTILERCRRQAFGGNAYQDMIVRLKLRQAFGRLIRRATDRGVFVVLDARLASRFTTAFPDGVNIQRSGLVEAIETVGEFLALARKRPAL